jgi:hypothetical protein
MTNSAHAMPCGYFLCFSRFLRNLSVEIGWQVDRTKANPAASQQQR